MKHNNRCPERLKEMCMVEGLTQRDMAQQFRIANNGV